jgi:5-formyltetrahydrofolate cyclo-ligase
VDKESVRLELLKALSSLGPEEIQSFSLSLTTQLIKLFANYPELTSQIGAAYLPLKAEIAPVYQELLRAVPLNLAYPILSEGKMEFAIPDGMPRGGIWLSPPFKVVTPEWLLVPGVGFDLAGARLGRGKGYYDRYLENRSCLNIGLCWSGQILEKIPVEKHDFHMDLIVTEKFCWDVKQQKKF